MAEPLDSVRAHGSPARPPEPRSAGFLAFRPEWTGRLLLLVGLAGLVFLFVLPQRVFTVRDEANYVGVAAAIAKHRSLDILKPDALDGLVPWITTREGHRVPQHPIGISAFAAPFVALFGWRICYFLALGMWLAGAFFFWRLLERERLPSAYVVLYLLFPPLLLYSRLFMADVPSATLCLAALYTLRIPEPRLPAGGPRIQFRDPPRGARFQPQTGGDPIHRGFTGRTRALLGMAALGLAFLVRPTNAIFVGPLALVALRQAMNRRDWLLLGALLSVGGVFFAMVLGLNQYYLGTPFEFSYPLRARFGFQHVARHLPFYALSLLVVYPLMLVAVGRAWQERRFVETFCITAGIIFYSTYYFIDRDSNPLLSLVRGQRFLLPYAMILLLFYAKMLHGWSFPRTVVHRYQVALVLLAVIGLGGVALAQARFTRDGVAAQAWAYRNTTGAADEVILYNVDSAEFLHGVFGPRNYRMIWSGSEAFGELAALDPSVRRVLVAETDHPQRRGQRYTELLLESGGGSGFAVQDVRTIGSTRFVVLERADRP